MNEIQTWVRVRVNAVVEHAVSEIDSTADAPSAWEIIEGSVASHLILFVLLH